MSYPVGTLCYIVSRAAFYPELLGRICTVTRIGPCGGVHIHKGSKKCVGGIDVTGMMPMCIGNWGLLRQIVPPIKAPTVTYKTNKAKAI